MSHAPQMPWKWKMTDLFLYVWFGLLILVRPELLTHRLIGLNIPGRHVTAYHFISVRCTRTSPLSRRLRNGLFVILQDKQLQS